MLGWFNGSGAGLNAGSFASQSARYAEGQKPYLMTGMINGAYHRGDGSTYMTFSNGWLSSYDYKSTKELLRMAGEAIAREEYKGDGRMPAGYEPIPLSKFIFDQAPKIASLNKHVLLQKSRPDLIGTGNVYRSGLRSDLEKDLFEHYWLGSGDDIKLTPTQMRAIMSEAMVHGKLVGDVTVVSWNNVQVMKATIDINASKEFGRGFGTATFYVDFKGNPVGFEDTYNFDPKPWGVRSYFAELVTRAVNMDGTYWGARGYKITYP